MDNRIICESLGSDVAGRLLESIMRGTGKFFLSTDYGAKWR